MVLAALMVPQVMSVIMIMFNGRQRVRAFGLSAGPNALWYNAGAFLLALLLTPREIT